MYKRGISAVVAMVMIILVTVALVALLWAVVIPLIDSQLQLAEQCRMAETSISIDFACTNVTGVSAIVTRSSQDFDLVDLQFGAGDAKGNLPAVFMISLLGFSSGDLPKKNTQRNYTADTTLSAIANIDRLQQLISLRVAPVVQYKNKQRICEPTAIVELPWCDPLYEKVRPKFWP